MVPASNFLPKGKTMHLSLAPGCTKHYYATHQMDDGLLAEATEFVKHSDNPIVGFDVNWGAPANLQLCFPPREHQPIPQDVSPTCSAMNIVLHFRSHPGSDDGLEALPHVAKVLLEDPSTLKVGFSCVGDIQKIYELFLVRIAGQVIDVRGIRPRKLGGNKEANAFNALRIFYGKLGKSGTAGKVDLVDQELVLKTQVKRRKRLMRVPSSCSSSSKDSSCTLGEPESEEGEEGDKDSDQDVRSHPSASTAEEINRLRKKG